MQSGLLLEKSFRMAKSDLQARPVYHRTRDSVEAHLTIVFAALAVSRWIEHQTGRGCPGGRTSPASPVRHAGPVPGAAGGYQRGNSGFRG